MLKLVQTDYGQFDLALIQPDDDAWETALRTLILATIFTDQLAPAGRVTDPYDQRGWWFDPQKGTGFWYLRRQPLSQAARRETVNMMLTALSKRPELSEITVSEIESQSHDERLRNVSHVAVQVHGLYDKRKFRLVLFIAPPKAAAVEDASVWDVDWDLTWVDQ